VVIYFEAVDLPELWDFFTALPTTVVVDHMGRPDVSLPVDGPQFALFEVHARAHQRVEQGQLPRAPVGHRPQSLERRTERLPDVIPFARRIVEQFPDRVLWGTDWPHPNLKDHMPDDGLLVDFIPHIAPTAELQQQAAGGQPDAPVLARGACLMALDKPYLDVPGTIIFDAEQSARATGSTSSA
jgi:2-pyrone-4,6-dicarboxylate lactonase